MQEISFDDFKVTANMETVSISREGSINFRPGEANLLTGLLGIALRMESLPALPSHIDDRPFRIEFTEDDALRIKRIDDSDALSLTWNDIDDFIKIVHSAVKISINDTTLNSSSNRHASTNPTDPDSPYLD